ncbi:MAG: M1 family peptidase, partial [Flavobacteriales bacterium]
MRFFGNLALLLVAISLVGQPLQQKYDFSKQDSLRGIHNEFRSWWDVQHYNLSVKPDFNKKYIEGINEVTFWVLDKITQKRIMQIDLQKHMKLDKVLFNGEVLSYTREVNVYFINFEEVIFEKKEQKITLF